MTEPTDTVPEPDVDSIRKRADAASEGPWECVLSGGVTLYTVRGKDDSGVFEIADCFQGEDDAEFIAHAKSDIPALLDALATAREEAARLREVLGVIAESKTLVPPFDIAEARAAARVALEEYS